MIKITYSQVLDLPESTLFYNDDTDGNEPNYILLKCDRECLWIHVDDMSVDTLSIDGISEETFWLPNNDIEVIGISETFEDKINEYELDNMSRHEQELYHTYFRRR